MSLFMDIKSERQLSLGKDRTKYQLLGTLIAEVQRKTTASDVEDTVVIQTIKKLLESVTESLKYATDKTSLEAEKLILENLLPKQLSSDELLGIMESAIESDPSLKEKKNMFPYLKANYDGQYNGKDANTLFAQLGD